MSEDPGSEVVDRVLAAAGLSDGVKWLVMTALDSDAALAEALEAPPHDAPEPRDPAVARATPVRAFLSGVSVEGFRGIGPRTSLQLVPAPGLVVVAGRNGSGKSSFAEALEVLLTRGSYRWRQRPAVWHESWRNVHRPEPASVLLELVEEGGAGTTKVAAEWPAAAGLDEPKSWVQRRGAKREAGLEVLGWTADLEMFRPFLSYDELGPLFAAEPSKLYEALDPILGLERLDDAQRRLGLQQKQLSRDKDEATRLGKQLKQSLKGVDDERAVEALAQLKRNKPDLEAIGALVTGSAVTTEGGELAALRSRATLPAPDPTAFAAARERYLLAVAAVRALEARTDQANARKAELLSAALAIHQEQGDGPCPVCERGTLDGDWAARVAAELATDEQAVQQRRAARREVGAAGSALVALVTPAPADLSAEQNRTGLEEAESAWRHWQELGSDPAALAAHGERALAELSLALETVTARAKAELAARQDIWQPIAAQLGGWLGHAQLARAQKDKLEPVVEAAGWLKRAALELRNERLLPLADQAREIWALLRQESNVDLGDVTLVGSSTRRHVELGASVDGVKTGALGVMSQGELHALALSLFLPKATSPDSPFGFLVIDDPVQAMDPAKVDGLARVLQKVARNRQVIVFTHDDRLPDSVRRLNIPGRLIEITRGRESVVTVADVSDPAARYLSDARAVASDPALTDEVRRRVIPELCRMSVESCCRDVYYGRALRSGLLRSEMEDRWAGAQRTRVKVALAVYLDAATSLDQWIRGNQRRKNALETCGTGAHHGLSGNMHAAISDVAALVQDVGAFRGR
jgi:energy-coupling factor transporter ATP-binding protein EcfA2